MLIGRSGEIRRINDRLETLARKHVSPVLIQGPSGVGKERAAHCLFTCSTIKGRFIPVNTAGITESLLDDALFGHARGAFTGAQTQSRGFLDVASGGMLFLDEIGVAPLALQKRLLRLVEQREYYPVGSTALRRFEGVLVFATSRDLLVEARKGRFLRDLAFRLQRAIVNIPPLDDRKADIPELVDYFLNRAPTQEAVQLGLDHDPRRGQWRVTTPAMRLLQAHHYPGNVRELIHVLASIVVHMPVANNEIGVQLVRQELKTVSSGDPESIAPLDDHIREYAAQALYECGGNATAAAAALRVSRGRLARILKGGGPDK